MRRANTFFATNWARVPFQPILFLFMFVGAILIVVFDVTTPAFDATAGGVFWQWILLSLICPPMALAAWTLIRFHSGKARYFGLLIRFGADVGQLASMSAFLTVVADDLDTIASEVYAAQLFTAVWWFLVTLVIRDIWKLALTERVATAIEERKQEVASDE